MTETKTTRNEKTPDSASRTAPISRRMLIVLGALCTISFLAHLAFFPQLPDVVPTHWDSSGNVNGWSSREATLMLDLLPLGLLALLNVTPRIDPRGHAYEHMKPIYRGFVAVTVLFLIAVTWTVELTVFEIIPNTESPIASFTVGAIGVGLALLGNYLPKVKRNYTFGIKTPWTLDNDMNWRLTHRVGGMALLVAGIAGAACALLPRAMGGTAVVVLLGGAIIASLIAYVYSYLAFRNGNRPLRSR